MATMKAALWDGEGTLRLSEVQRPEPGTGDALVRVRACGICGSDLTVFKDKTEPDPLPAGHEVTGEVVAIGDGVDSTLVGQRVAIDTICSGQACLDCYYCRMGKYLGCENKAGLKGGGFAEYIVRRAAGCFPIPDHLSWEEGALTEPLAVSVHAVRRGEMAPGETVVVLGAGTIGLAAVAAARGMGAGKVFVSARHPQQAEMAKRLGADETLPSEGAPLKEAVDGLTQGRGADLTIESVGGHQTDTFHQAIDVTRVQGRIIILGGFAVPATVKLGRPLIKEHSIVFSVVYDVIDGRHDYEIAIDLMAQGRAPLKQIVTHKVSLDDIQKGLNTAYDKSTGSIKVQVYQ